MWRAHRRPFIAAGVIKFIHDAVMFTGPFLLELLLKHVQSGGGSAWTGFAIACALALSAVIETLTVNVYFHILFRICLHLKTELIDVVYRKSLRMSIGAKNLMGSGAVANLQSNDAAKLWSLPQYLHMVWSGPLQILAVMALLVRIIHWGPALVGLGVTLALIPLSALVARALARVRKRILALTDARVKLCGEVITGIKAIKLYAWEGPYRERIQELRERELKEIRTSAVIGTWNTILWQGGPILISMAAFGSYALWGYQLTAAVAFPALALFNLLRFPVMMFPTQLQNLVNAKVALDRVQKFIDMDEMKQEGEGNTRGVGGDAGSSNAVDVIAIRGDARFSWSPQPSTSPNNAVQEHEQGNEEVEQKIILYDINLRIRSGGQLVMVIGSVGAGKSSLLAAILGEMVCIPNTASVNVQGTIAYTQQDPWIQNASLKENILLGTPYEASRYNQVISACALLPDLAVLPAGDATEIGEKGVNLSGGQKHRVALARACYADADVYLLDDPLSAVDVHVGRHVFDHCVLGVLSQKTRVLVTHQLQYLSRADVVVVMQGGRIVEQGSFEALMQKGVDLHQYAVVQNSTGNSGPDGTDDIIDEDASSTSSTISVDKDEEGNGLLLPSPRSTNNLLMMDDSAKNLTYIDDPSDHAADTTTATETTTTNANDDDAPSSSLLPPQQQQQKHHHHHHHKKPTNDDDPTHGGAQLTKAEERAVGRVSRHIYLAYFLAWGPLLLVPSTVLGLAITERGMQAGQNWWLSIWSEAMSVPMPATPTPTEYYLKIYFIIGMASLCFQIVRAIILVLGSINAARGLHRSLLHTVLRLPMSFFDSQPTGRLLNRFTRDTEAVDTAIQSSVSSFLNCAVSVLWSLVVVVAVSPAIAATLVPLSLAYWVIQKRYIATSRELKRLDSLALSPIFSHFTETLAGLMTVRAFRAQRRFIARDAVLLNESNRCYWPAQCVNRWLSVRLELLGIAVVFGTAVVVTCVMPVSAGLAGLALTSALNLTGLMNWMVRQTTELEVSMNSVERMVEYEETQQPEAPEIVEAHRPLPAWPHRGAITVHQLYVKYRPDLDPVLRGVSFAVKPQEKVGVVGRTGSGKSSLMLALYRIVEPYAGRIVIDGIDVQSIGLYDLRSRLALVPQDPVIFSGTVRSNLDPFGEYDAHTSLPNSGICSADKVDGTTLLWHALDRTGLGPTIRALPGQLDAPIAEGGSNFSAGQRQLLCMARALLRKSRILILDEATSSIDSASDAVVQHTIATAFADSTVLTIAHRLHTIIASDRILVLGGGRSRSTGNLGS